MSRCRNFASCSACGSGSTCHRARGPRAGAEDIQHLADGHSVVVPRPEVPAALEARIARVQPFGQLEIARQQLQHVLPGADCRGVADDGRLARHHGPHHVRDQAVPGPVAAADDVAGPRRRQSDLGAAGPGRREERAAIGGHHELGATLAAAVGVVAAHGVDLAAAPVPLRVLVAFVAGYHHHGTDAGGRAHAFQHAHGAHDVGHVGAHRVLVRQPHDRLGGEVEHDLGFAFGERLGQGLPVEDVADHRAHGIAHARDAEEVGVGRRRQRIARDARPHRPQPQGKPAALEAGMSGQEDAFTVPEGGSVHELLQALLAAGIAHVDRLRLHMAPVPHNGVVRASPRRWEIRAAAHQCREWLPLTPHKLHLNLQQCGRGG